MKEVYALHGMYSDRSWYDDYSLMSYERLPWIIRGGSVLYDDYDGIFNFDKDGGYAFSHRASRLVISQ